MQPGAYIIHPNIITGVAMNCRRLCPRAPHVLLLPLLLMLAIPLTGCQSLFGAGKGAPLPTASQPAASAAPCVVLALPSAGPYAPISEKITKGARMALREMSSGGTVPQLEIINTEAPDWLEKISALPPACAVVGGPLQARNYAEARKAGLVDQRAIFAFMPSLEQGDEGVRAWRFFPSPQDQIDALITFATDGLSIRTYGAFYPADAYGAGMATLLEQSLAKQNILLQKATYNPADVNAWTSAVAPLINASTPEGSSTPIPQTAFEALFLPDSWKNMDMLATSLLYNGEDRLVLLGTTLWEQGLAGKLLPNAEKYALAVFPGAWNPARAPAALREGGTDFWVALGYDFTRFAVNMGLNARLDAAEINTRARRSERMIWGMAPINWDSDGIAHQKLFLFQVTGTGMVPLNQEQFILTRNALLQRAAMRMQGLPLVGIEGLPDGAAGLPGQPGQVGMPAPGGPLPMSTTPLPSYKLKLPTRP